MNDPWVFLHGWGMTPQTWQALLVYFPLETPVYCLALPGHGGDQNAADWNATLKRYEEIVPRNAIWVGWSLGGLLAIEFAKRYPESVKKLILIATNPHWLSLRDWPGVPPGNWWKFKKTAEQNLQRALQQLLFLQGFAIKKGDMTHLPGQQTSLDAPPQLLKTLDWLAERDLRATLASLLMPVLQVFGRLDRLVPVALVEKILGMVPQQTVIIMDEVSHAPMQTHPYLLAKHILNWSYQ